MDASKIEAAAIISLKNAIMLHDYMKDYINDNDKEPSWDGHIYLYSNSQLRVEDIEYRVPVQVKGKNKPDYLKKKRITYPVEYSHLRNYEKDGGVCYFVIAISDDRRQTSIFYASLTPIKLQDYLKGTEKKKGEQTKSITLTRLQNNDPDELYKILLQFGHDSKAQGGRELIKKSINFEDMAKIDSIQMTSFTNREEETMDKLKSGEICLFGHRTDLDMWVPFNYKCQKQMVANMVQVAEIHDSVSIDDEIFYSKYKLEKTLDNTFRIRLSENLIIDGKKQTIQFSAIGSLESLKTDIKFLQAMPKGECIRIHDEPVLRYKDAQLGEELQKVIEKIELNLKAFEKYGIVCKKRVEDFTEENWDSINKIINIYKGGAKLKEKSLWYIWKWDEKIVPLLLVKEDNRVNAYNVVADKRIEVKLPTKKKNYRIPRFSSFERDVWEKLYDVEEEILLEEIERSDFNLDTQDTLILLLLEIIAVYDRIKDEKYYDLAMLLADKILEIDSTHQVSIINKLQILRRKRELSEEELQTLEEIESKTDDAATKCAVNILLGNKRKAQKELEKLSKEDKKTFLNYPIYNLL